MSRNNARVLVPKLVDAVEMLPGTVARKKFYLEIFTSHERKTLRLRWTIMRMLSQGVAQREIARKLNVSLCKITRGARILRNKKSMMYRLLHRENKGTK